MKSLASPIPSNSFTAFQSFQFKRKSGSRRVTLEDVLPNDPDLGYCAVFTEGFTKLDGKDLAVASFGELFNALGEDPDVNIFERIRQSGKLYEGRKTLSRCVTEQLIRCSTGAKTAFIKCWDSPESYTWSVPLERYLETYDLLFGLPHRFGEFEVSDECARWYLRIRDDDPVIFLAGSMNLVKKLGLDCAQWVLQVPRIMKYVG